MIYLEPMTRETGALRVIPGSHHQDFRSSLLPLNKLHVQAAGDGALEYYGVTGEALPCVALETTPGDLVIFDHYLYHSVYHKRQGRRYVAMKFAARPTLPAHFEALEREHQGASELDAGFRNHRRPRIAAMVTPLLEGFTGPLP